MSLSFDRFYSQIEALPLMWFQRLSSSSVILSNRYRFFLTSSLVPRGALINLGLLLRLSRLGFVQDVAEYKEEFAGLPETLRAVFNCTLLLGSGTVSGKLLASCLNCCVLSLSMSRCTSQRQVSGKHGTNIFSGSFTDGSPDHQVLPKRSLDWRFVRCLSFGRTIPVRASEGGSLVC